MKLLAMLLLSGNLFLATTESVEINEISTEEVSEVVSEENTEQEQTELQQLLEQWLNGEIDLDDITLQKIYDKLGAVSQEDIDVMLQKYSIYVKATKV